MTADRGLQLAQTFAEISTALLAEESLQRTMNRVVDIAMETIAGCEHAAVSLVHRRKISTEACSGDMPRRVDAIQYQTGEGPCLDAIKEHAVIQVEDLMTDDRWPQFARSAAQQTGVRSMLCFRIFDEEDTVGALNLYAAKVRAFDEEAVALGSILTAHAAVAVVGARTKEQLEESIYWRDIIGQAKGIMMARHGLTERDAFAVLVKGSQRLNMKLREVAERVAETGELPER